MIDRRPLCGYRLTNYCNPGGDAVPRIHYAVILSLVSIPSPARAGDKGFNVTVGDKAIEFYAGNQLVTRLHIAPSYAKPIFWPLHAPNGAPLTRAWPMVERAPSKLNDHPHQKSAWWCHGDIIPEGLELKKK